MVEQFPVTERTQMRRRANRATYDRDVIYPILDEALIASVATVIDGRPQVQPMIHVRLGDQLILHGLGTNRLLNAIASGAEACINVAIIDALALARRIEDHSMHYRSATIYGRGKLVTAAAQKLRLMEHVFESLMRSDRMRTLPALAPSYLAGTMVVTIPIEEAVGKVNLMVETGDGPDGIWSGIIPLISTAGKPEPDARTRTEGLDPDPAILDYGRR